MPWRSASSAASSTYSPARRSPPGRRLGDLGDGRRNRGRRRPRRPAVDRVGGAVESPRARCGRARRRSCPASATRRSRRRSGREERAERGDDRGVVALVDAALVTRRSADRELHLDDAAGQLASNLEAGLPNTPSIRRFADTPRRRRSRSPRPRARQLLQQPGPTPLPCSPSATAKADSAIAGSRRPRSCQRNHHAPRFRPRERTQQGAALGPVRLEQRLHQLGVAGWENHESGDGGSGSRGSCRSRAAPRRPPRWAAAAEECRRRGGSRRSSHLQLLPRPPLEQGSYGESVDVHLSRSSAGRPPAGSGSPRWSARPSRGAMRPRCPAAALRARRKGPRNVIWPNESLSGDDVVERHEREHDADQGSLGCDEAGLIAKSAPPASRRSRAPGECRSGDVARELRAPSRPRCRRCRR